MSDPDALLYICEYKMQSLDIQHESLYGEMMTF